MDISQFEILAASSFGIQGIQRYLYSYIGPYHYIIPILKDVCFVTFGDWGLGIGDWGLGIGDWGLGICLDIGRDEQFWVLNVDPCFHDKLKNPVITR
jgi:hypothetical protein